VVCVGCMKRLLGCQVVGLLALNNSTTEKLNNPSTGSNAAGAFAATQNATNPRQKHFLSNRLPQKVRRSELEGARFDFRAGHAGDEDGGRVDPFLDIGRAHV